MRRRSRSLRAARSLGADARVRALLDWFPDHRRPLPWRRRRTPYRVWVSEVMLQQTRVAQAVPYFERFLRRFPSLRVLAAASEEQVLKVWEGAGYYGRARNLHRAARQLVREQGGRIPRRSAELRKLPGVGPYIAAAVASLAYGEPDLALDSNGRRVLARWTLERSDPSLARFSRRLESWAVRHVPPERLGEFNEALMELGETLCRPTGPQCAVCPAASACRARQELPDPGAIPSRRRRGPKPLVVGAVTAIERGGRWLVLRRPSAGLLGGLWEFPGGKLEPGESPEAAGRRELREETGLTVGVLEPVATVRHEYSHFRVALHLFRSRSPRGRLRVRGRRHRWVGMRELRRLPLPRATLKMIPFLRPARDPGRVYRG